jgi:Reverse transcriptase (RNA-dependent DNA polymerase)
MAHGFSDGELIYEWTRAPFGLRNSGASFVRMLQRVLNPVRDCAGSYVDDLAVFSNEWDDPLKHLDRTVQGISDCGLIL